jgi:uncharacterized membrane protein YeaQ/YmgE (transglycosylase-associated protein family)
MGILSWIVVGLIAGWLAGKVMGHGYGLIGDIIIGLIGGLLGGWLAGAFFGAADAVNGFNLTSILVAFIGALLLIGVSRLLFHPRSA